MKHEKNTEGLPNSDVSGRQEVSPHNKFSLLINESQDIKTVRRGMV